MVKQVTLESTITCPECGHEKDEVMPTDACQFFYECENCKTVLKPKTGDCCVYCSYGTEKCPPIQLNKSCCRIMYSDSPKYKARMLRRIFRFTSH